MNTKAIKNVTNRFNFQTMPVDGGWYEYTVHRAGHKTIIQGGIVKSLKAAQKAARIEIRKLEGLE